MSKNHPITACCQNENGGQSQHGSIILNPMGAPPCRQTNLLRYGALCDTRFFARVATRLARSTILRAARSEEHTSELQSLMRISYAVFCLKKKKIRHEHHSKIKSHKYNRRR